MSHLIDVDFLVAAAWELHDEHSSAEAWLLSLPGFSTCAAVQMGFLRVSMSPAYKASFQSARRALLDLASLKTHVFLADHTEARDLPEVQSRHDVTDAHLVTLARANSLKLATLDKELCRKDWAAGVAYNPLLP